MQLRRSRPSESTCDRFVDAAAAPCAALAHRTWACTVARALLWLRADYCECGTILPDHACTPIEFLLAPAFDGHVASEGSDAGSSVEAALHLGLRGVMVMLPRVLRSPSGNDGTGRHRQLQFTSQWFSMLAQLRTLQCGAPQQGSLAGVAHQATLAALPVAQGDTDELSDATHLAVVHTQLLLMATSVGAPQQDDVGMAHDFEDWFD